MPTKLVVGNYYIVNPKSKFAKEHGYHVLLGKIVKLERLRYGRDIKNPRSLIYFNGDDPWYVISEDLIALESNQLASVLLLKEE